MVFSILLMGTNCGLKGISGILSILGGCSITVLTFSGFGTGTSAGLIDASGFTFNKFTSSRRRFNSTIKSSSGVALGLSVSIGLLTFSSTGLTSPLSCCNLLSKSFSTF